MNSAFKKSDEFFKEEQILSSLVHMQKLLCMEKLIATLSFKSSLVVGPARKDLSLNPRPRSTPRLDWL